MASCIQNFDESVPVLWLVVGTVDENDMCFCHCALEDDRAVVLWILLRK